MTVEKLLKDYIRDHILTKDATTEEINANTSNFIGDVAFTMGHLIGRLPASSEQAAGLFLDAFSEGLEVGLSHSLGTTDGKAE